MIGKTRLTVTDPEKMELYDERFDDLEVPCSECGATAERLERWVADSKTEELEEFVAAGFKCTECGHVEGV